MITVFRNHHHVSIPERVLEALKPGGVCSPDANGIYVSIPERVLEALKH